MPLLGLFSSIGTRLAQTLAAIGLYNVVEMFSGTEKPHSPQINPTHYALLGVFGSISAFWGYKYFTSRKRRRKR